MMALLNEPCNPLVWPDHNRVITEKLQQLYSNEELVDVTLTTSDGQVVAHRSVLAAASPVLHSQLQRYLHTANAHGHLVLDSFFLGCTAQDLRSVIGFIYYGQVSVPQSRMSAFIGIARELQLIGFHEPHIMPSTNNNLRNSSNTIGQRAMSAPRPLHVLNRPEASALSAELQNLIPPLPLPLAPSFIHDPSQSQNTTTAPPPPPPSMPQQLLDTDMLSQEGCYMNSNIMQESSANPSLYSSKYREMPGMFGDSIIKMDHGPGNWRNISGALSNSTFADMCPNDTEMGSLILGDSRTLNSTLRSAFPESLEGQLAAQESSYPKDYSQSSLKLKPSSMCGAVSNNSAVDILVDQGPQASMSCANVPNIGAQSAPNVTSSNHALASHSQDGLNLHFSGWY